MTGSSKAGRCSFPSSSAADPTEPVDENLRSFYERLLAFLGDGVFREGEWTRAERAGWDENDTWAQLVGWGWRGASRKLVVVNLGDEPAEGHVSLPWDDLLGATWLLDDAADGQRYERRGEDLCAGMYVSLPPWHWHLFDVTPIDSPNSHPAVTPKQTTAEHRRLAEATGRAEDDLFSANPWYEWGPYLSERAWGTVREDYSEGGDAWASFPHDHARSRAYRWNEDGMAGISDVRHELCLALALWNGRDAILKERMFGLTGPQGNHGEDVKEYWWYLEGLPSHALLRWRYHYPQAAFPYEQLVDHRRGLQDPELELLDTGVFDDDRYWAVDVTYAKSSPTEILQRIVLTNHGADEATLHVLPTLWFRNTWSWGGAETRPRIERDGADLFVADHALAGYRLQAAPGPDGSLPEPLFCENETNTARVFGTEALTPFPKDGINDHIVSGLPTVNPDGRGTKAAFHYAVTVAGGASAELRLVLHRREGKAGPKRAPKSWAGDRFDQALAAREADADEFYAALAPRETTPEAMQVLRQASAGLVWSKQMYPYDVGRWLDGDPGVAAPPQARQHGRNSGWRHLDSFDVLAMPDPWEYPWFAAWDLGFHAVPWAHLDPAFAKYQLLVLLREWFMHPNGALPAYEWNFDDVNPPVHVMAALRVFRIDGSRDREFLERVFQKLLVNYSWWVNRQDADGNNVFGGGFLGLDNISPVDRSTLPEGVTLEQADGTAWMAYYTVRCS